MAENMKKCYQCKNKKPDAEFSSKGSRIVHNRSQLICNSCIEHIYRKNWDVPCQVCEQKPTVGDLKLCGPCTWGEAATAGGNW